jgi:hypothetical protein
LTRFAGRHKRIKDLELQSIRDSLVTLLGDTWSEVGWNLQRIETREDVPGAFSPWKQEERPHALFRILLRQPQSPEILWPSDCRAFGVKLDAIYREIGTLADMMRQFSEFQQHSRNSLDQADRALRAATAVDQQRSIVEERANRKRTLELAKDTYLWLNRYYQELNQTLNDGYAHFAHAEIIRFRNSHRNRLNPWRIANAMAGLPFLGYRQSIKRCSRFKREKAAGLRYEIFRTIRRILKSGPLSIGLTGHVESWLRNRKPSNSLAISELQKKWYYLEPSVQAVSGTGIEPETQAYEITREYFRRIATRSAADELLEADRRIHPMVKLKRVKG